MLLLHGLWTSSLSFRNLIPLLAREHRLVLPELLDPSGRVLLPNADYHPGSLAGMILELCRVLELQRPLIVGHAECGLGALLLALDHPEALSALVVIGSTLHLSRTDRLRGKLFRHPAMVNRWAERGFRRPLETALGMIAYADSAVFSRQEIRHLARCWVSFPGALTRARILAQTLEESYGFQVLEALQRYSAGGKKFPTRLSLVYGDTDRRASVKDGLLLNQMFPGSELLVAQNSSASVQVERPEWIARVIANAAAVAAP